MEDSKKSLREQLNSLSGELYRDTMHLSSPYQITSHPAYRKVISLGPDVIPFMLEDFVCLLNKEDMRFAFWFEALRELSGENPVPEAHAGELGKVMMDWVLWGSKKGYIADVSGEDFPTFPKGVFREAWETFRSDSRKIATKKTLTFYVFRSVLSVGLAWLSAKYTVWVVKNYVHTNTNLRELFSMEIPAIILLVIASYIWIKTWNYFEGGEDNK